MVDPLHFLLDNRTFVQITGDKMCRGPDQFDATFKGLVIRFGPLKPGRNEW
jgi:hypothetical protein